MLRWLDRIPLLMLAIIAIPLTLAPVSPEPHLVEKLRMLVEGRLSAPVDIFDLLLHGTPAVLVIAKLLRMARRRASDKQATV